MQAPPPPPIGTPSSPLSSMDSLLGVDVASLRTDVVLMYAERVVRLHASKGVATEKAQMLFVLAQKLLRWFLQERKELDRLNQTLQETLLNALKQCDQTSCTNREEEEVAVKTEVTSFGVQTEMMITADAEAQTGIEEESCEHHACIVTDAWQQTEELVTEKINASAEPEWKADNERDNETQTQATESTESQIQTEETRVEVVEGESQIEVGVSDAEMQTDENADRNHLTSRGDEARSVCDSELQTNIATEQLVDTVSQTEQLSIEVVDGLSQTENDAVETPVQTELDVDDSETQTSYQVENPFCQTEIVVAADAINALSQWEATTIDLQCQTDLSAFSSVDGASQTRTEVTSQHVQAEATSDTMESPSQTEFEVEESECQTESVPETTVDALSQTLLEISDEHVQTELESVDSHSQTEQCGAVMVDTHSQTNTLWAHDQPTQTESVPVLERAVQVTSEPLQLADVETETLVIQTMDSHTQVAPEAWPGRDEGVQTDTVEQSIKQGNEPLTVYFEVHQSVVRMQRIIRGFVTRKRFYRMLDELVNAK